MARGGRLKSNFWQESEPVLLLNPRTSADELALLQKAFEKNKKENHIYLRSSGTESQKKGIKLVALSRNAFLISARSVVKHLELSEKDHWLNPLPSFHVGGLSISARCFLANAKESQFDVWDVNQFVNTLIEREITAVSLVPTQVFDLVQSRSKPNPELRFVLVGGGKLPSEVYEEAISLGWPMVLSYGMTETAAMMAASSVESTMSPRIPSAILLDHVELKPNGEKFEIQSESLFSGYLWVDRDGNSSWEPRPEPFILDDRLELDGRVIRVLGRESELVKVLGESVNIVELEEKVTGLINAPCAVVAASDQRKGHNLFLFTESKTADLEKINLAVMPFERFESIRVVESLPRTELGKLKRSELKL